MTIGISAAVRPQRGRSGWVEAWPVYPLLLLLLAIFVYPVGQILVLSLFDPAGQPTAANYVRVVSTPVYLQTLAITFEIAGWTTALAMLLGYPVAFLLAHASARVRDTLTLLVLMPFWTSFLVRTFAWMVLLGRNGAVNRLLLSLGIVDAPVALIFNFTGVMIGMVHAMMPLAILAMLSVMQRIDTNLLSAARTLGARGGQAFWRIYFPLSLPGVAAGGLLVFITALGFFITPALLGGARDITLAMLIDGFVEEQLAWPLAGAASVILLAATLAVLAVAGRAMSPARLADAA